VPAAPGVGAVPFVPLVPLVLSRPEDLPVLTHRSPRRRVRQLALVAVAALSAAGAITPIASADTPTPGPPPTCTPFPGGPVAPKNLSVSNITSTTAQLSWSPSTKDTGCANNTLPPANGYVIQTTDGTVLGTTDSYTTSTLLTGLSPHTSYSVVVGAIDVGFSVPLTFSTDVGPIGPLPPTITSVSPSHGPAAGGNTITINGQFHGSGDITDITFGPNRVVTGFSYSTDAGGGLTISTKVPAGAAGTTVDVTVATTAGTSSITTGDQYTYDAPTGDVAYRYSLSGAATLKTLTTGSVPLTGSIAASLDLPSGAFTGTLALNQATAKLTSLGFLPVVAKIAIVPTAPVTGTLSNGKLLANATVRIKIPSASVLGIPIASGAGCQAGQVSGIALHSTDAFFQPLSGGTLAGTFPISSLVGCGALTGLVSTLTAGPNNAIVLKLTPPPVVTPTPTPTPLPLPTPFPQPTPTPRPTPTPTPVPTAT
jgi:hypothetical protein